MAASVVGVRTVANVDQPREHSPYSQRLGKVPTMKLMTVDLTADDGTDFANWSTTGEVSPAESVDRLIRVLAETRKSMEPAVPGALPLIIKQPPQVHAPAWQWSMEPDGSLVLNLRHPGLGWLGFRLPDVEGFHTNLVDVILQRNALREELEAPKTPT